MTCEDVNFKDAVIARAAAGVLTAGIVYYGGTAEGHWWVLQRSKRNPGRHSNPILF